MAANQGSRHNDRDKQSVRPGGAEQAILLVIVESPNVFDWLGLGLELKRRKFLGKKKLVQIPEKRLPEGLFENISSQEQVQLRLIAWGVRIHLFGSHSSRLDVITALWGRATLTIGKPALYTDVRDQRQVAFYSARFCARGNAWPPHERTGPNSASQIVTLFWRQQQCISLCKVTSQKTCPSRQ